MPKQPKPEPTTEADRIKALEAENARLRDVILNLRRLHSKIAAELDTLL